MAINRNFNRRIVLILMILFWWASVTQAAVPLLINYQGSLTDDMGSPVDGTYTIQFYLYDDAIGGASPWNEEQDVTVTGGIYNVHLGGVSALNADVFMADALYLEVLVYNTNTSTFEVLSPRQQLTSVPFAIQAGSTPAGAVTTIMLADEAVTETKVATAAITADKIDGGAGSGVDADLLDGLDASSFSPSGHNHDGSYYSQDHVDALEDRIAALEAKLQYLTVVAGTVNQMPGPHVMITGANLHVRSGSGSTDGPINGRGNLIVGYNELRVSGDDRTGSHNLVTGQQQNYTAFGGLVVGYFNTISGPYASVSGGQRNTASGSVASVSGGIYSTASGLASSVSGGSFNDANEYASSVGGGQANTASGANSSVNGGRYNISSGHSASVSGGGGENAGDGNEAFADYSAILGGRGNVTGDKPSGDHTIATQSTVSGGYINTASGLYSSVSGGYDNTASGDYASVSGGSSNTADNYYTSVSGGYDNTASGSRASISGGDSNTASGYYASVSGGSNNTASGISASISGGDSNTASNSVSSVSGGTDNWAHDLASSVSGGRYNYADGDYASISGGSTNKASGEYASISGGLGNWAAGDQSSVSGGYGNITNVYRSSVVGDADRVYVDDTLIH